MTKSSQSFELTNGQNEGCDLNEEFQQEGTIKFHVFKSYYKAVGPFLFWMIILSLITMQASRNLSDLWLAYWISQTGQGNSSDSGNTTIPTPTPTFETILQDSGGLNLGNNSVPYINFKHDTDEENPAFEWSITDAFVDYIPFVDGLDPEVKFYFSIFILIGLANSVFT